MNARVAFVRGALLGLVAWPVLVFALLVAVNIGNAKRNALHDASTAQQRREWVEFEAAHPELAGEGS